MRLFSTADGLSSGLIHHMMRDSHGFIWFCTRDGLSRFDGYRFTNYKIADGPTSQNFSFIFESRQGIFWIVLSGKGLYRYDPASAATSLHLSQTALGTDDNNVVLDAELVVPKFAGSLFEDRAGTLWMAGSGLFQVEEKEGHAFVRKIDLHVPQSWQPTFSVHSVAEGTDGSLWLGTTNGLLRRLPDGRVTQYTLRQNQRSDFVRLVMADKNGNIWASHPGGVLRSEP